MSGIIYYLKEFPEDLPKGSFAYEKIRIEVAVQLAAERLGSIKAVAESIGVSRTVIYNWIGKARLKPHVPTRKNLQRLARLLNVPVEMLEE